MRKYTIFALIILAVLLAGCGSDDYAIAKIGKTYLYKSQFERVFPPMKGATEEQNREKAEVVLQNTLKQFVAYEYLKETNQVPEDIANMVKKSIRGRLLENVYNDLVTKKIHVPEYEVYQKFERERTTIWAQHIMVDNKKLADSLYAILRVSPEMFETYAIEFSKDNTTNQNNGLLKPFSGGKMVKPFEDACFKQGIGIIGKPVETPFGWHIIRVNKREQKDLSDYETAGAKIRKDMETEQKKKYEDESVEMLKKIALLKINDNNIQAFIDGTKDFRNVDATVKLDSLSPEVKNLVLCTSIFGAWTADSIVYYSMDLGFGNVAFHSIDYVKNSIDRVIFFMSIYQRGERMGTQFDNNILKESNLSAAIYTEQNIVKQLNSAVVVNDSLLKDYYDNHIEDFMKKGSAGVFIVVNHDSSKVAAAYDSIGIKPFEELSRIHSTIKPKEFSLPSYYMYSSDDTLGYYKTAMELGKTGKVSKIFKNGLGFNFIKVMSLKKAEPEDFNLIKNNQLITAYKKFVVDGMIAENYATALEVVDTVVYRDKYNKMLDEILSKL